MNAHRAQWKGGDYIMIDPEEVAAVVPWTGHLPGVTDAVDHSVSIGINI